MVEDELRRALAHDAVRAVEHGLDLHRDPLPGLAAAVDVGTMEIAIEIEEIGAVMLDELAQGIPFRVQDAVVGGFVLGDRGAVGQAFQPPAPEGVEGSVERLVRRPKRDHIVTGLNGLRANVGENIDEEVELGKLGKTVNPDPSAVDEFAQGLGSGNVLVLAAGEYRLIGEIPEESRNRERTGCHQPEHWCRQRRRSREFRNVADG